MTAALVHTALRCAGATDVGKVRAQNEDAMIVDPMRGLYAVLDGMGGANAGDVASRTARDAIAQYVIERRDDHDTTKELLEAAIQHAGQTVWSAAQASRERHGMGTTCVACLVHDGSHAVVGHVGDSRAYLLRESRLLALTRDHTVVEELVNRGLLAPEDVSRHPYKNVLSRNLGAKPDTHVDLAEVEMRPGDRILLCSDGLYGYASADAIQYLLGSGDEPQHVARDLIDLALRGGGGDNITAIVLEAPTAAPTSTQLVRTSGAIAWWQQRQRFLQVAEQRGFVHNPMCRGLRRDDALELIALSLCQAVFHDLEKSTGVNVWTFAQHLARGWFDRGGSWQPLRELVDSLTFASRAALDEIRAGDAALGTLMDIAVSRALVVAELAIGGVLGERLGRTDRDLVAAHAAAAAIDRTMDRTVESTIESMAESMAESMIDRTVDDTADPFIDQATVPFQPTPRPVPIDHATATAIAQAMTVARANTPPGADLVSHVLGAVEAIATAPSAMTAAQTASRQLCDARAVDEAAVMPLYDALDETRRILTASVHQLTASEPIRAGALRAVSTSLKALAVAVASAVCDAARPFTERLRQAQLVTSELRTEVAQAERARAALEGKFAATIDQSQPWEQRGTTEW